MDRSSYVRGMPKMSAPHSPQWTLDDINWDQFDPGKVDPDILKAVKAASLVEANSPDYVTYLNNVFGHDAATRDAFEQWGVEEAQHGRALAAWAKRADPGFDFDAAFARFQSIYCLPLDAEESVRGSRLGEMVARCVVESGTSSYYTAMRDLTDEPVLREIATNIAADEFRHYKLFYETIEMLEAQEKVSTLNRIWVALTRFKEADDDELAAAYFAANAPLNETFDAKTNSGAYEMRAFGMYQRKHMDRACAMMAKAMGLSPQGALGKLFASATWWTVQARLWRLGRQNPTSKPGYKAAA